MENPKISLRGQGFGHKRPIRRWGPYSPPVFGGPQALDLQPARVAHIRRPAFYTSPQANREASGR